MYLSRGSYLRTSALCKWHFPRDHVLSAPSSWLMLYRVHWLHVKNCITFSLYLSFFSTRYFSDHFACPSSAPQFSSTLRRSLSRRGQWRKTRRWQYCLSKQWDILPRSRESRDDEASPRVHLKRPPGISRTNTKIKL